MNLLENYRHILLDLGTVRWLIIFLAGGFGVSLRVVAIEFFGPRHHSEFPWGVFVANGLGCFVIGLLIAIGESRLIINPTIRQALQAGFLGGFTTFSAFSLDTWRLFETGEITLGITNALASIIVGLTAVGLGLIIGRQLL